MSYTKEDIWVVIPAFNEESVIGSVVEGLVEHYANVVVVDDCSSDETASRVLESGAWCVSHIINLGQGAALQTGFDFAKSKGAKAVVTFDADGQHRVKDIQRLLDRQKETDCDVVLGSRFLGETEGMSLLRKYTLKLAVLYMTITTGAKLSDAHNGLRLLTETALDKIKITQNRMAHASEIIAQIIQYDLKVEEAPVKITYTDYSVAKGQRASASIRILAELLAARLMR